jgi:hypothetical protein
MDINLQVAQIGYWLLVIGYWLLVLSQLVFKPAKQARINLVVASA